MALLPDRHNFVLWHGGTFRSRLTLYTDAAGSAPRNLTGYTARMPIYNKLGGTVLLTLTTENGGITLNGVTGNIDLYISATTTAAATWKNAIYELEIIGPSSGDVDPLLYGAIAIKSI